MSIPFVDLFAQYKSIKEEIDSAIAAVIAESAYIKGKYPEKFERAFAEFLGISHCIGCANGTDAIEVVLKALGVGPGDEVIVPANTWISTAEAFTSVGADVVFVDPDPELYTISPSAIRNAVTPKTRAIIPVHLYGLTCDMKGVMEVAKGNNLAVIEDCAQAHGARFNGQLAGTFGDAATFSFFPGKNLGAYGDAGAIVCKDSELARLCRMICDHGRLGKFDHGLAGRNSRLDGLQAAILSAKLPHLKKWTALRQEHAMLYLTLLKGLRIQLPKIPPGYEHVFHLFVVQVPSRELIQAHLNSKSIASGIHYPIALPFTKAYRSLGAEPKDFPTAYNAMTRILSLPMYAELSQEMINRICCEVEAALDLPLSSSVARAQGD